MLKYFDLLKNLSIDEKISLLIARKKFVNSKIDNYDFPIIDLKDNLFDSYEFLANTWNNDLFKKMGCYFKVINSNKASVLSFESDNVFISSSNFLSSQIEKSLIEGSNIAGGVIVLDNLDANGLREFCENNYDDVVNAKPFAISINAPFIDSIKEFYHGLLFVNCTNSLDIIKTISTSKGLIVADYDKDTIISCVNEAIKKYDEYKLLLQDGKLSRADFHDFEVAGDILSVDTLDNAVDFLLDKLNEYDSLINTTPSEVIDSDRIIQDVCDESVILLKNEDILPITKNDSVAVFGCEVEKTFGRSSYQSVISNYDLNVVGYSKAVIDNNLDLNAVTLAKQAKYLIYFLNDQYNFDNDLKAIERLKEYNDNIIIVLNSNKLINITFSNLCKGLIYNSFLCEKSINSVLNIIIGELNPSGHISVLLDNLIPNSYDYFIKNNKKPQFNLAYGLSYTSFEYSYLRALNESVSVHIENTGNYDGKELVRVYLKKPTDNYLQLIAFDKVSLKKGEKRNVIIPLNKLDFAVFDQEKNKYVIDGGEYNIVVVSAKEDYKLEAVLNLVPKVISDDVELKLSDEEIADGYFEGICDEPKKSNFNVKIISLVLVSIYLLSCLGVLLYMNLMNYLVFLSLCIAMGVVFIVFVALLIIFICKHKKEKNFSSGKTLTDYVNEMPEYNSLAHISYNVPVHEENVNIIEEKTDDYLDNKVENNEVIKEENSEDFLKPIASDENLELGDSIIDNNSVEAIDDAVEVNEPVSKDDYLDDTVFNDINIEDVATNLQAYLNDNGILLSILSIRVLLSAVFTSRTVFINSKDHDLLIKALKCLDKFLGNDSNIYDSQSYNNFVELISKRDNDVFGYTEVSNGLLNAIKLKNHLNLMIFDHVTTDKLSLFSDFILSAGTELSHYINLNGKFELPKNICYVFVFDYDFYLEVLPKNYLEKATAINLTIQKNELPSDNLECGCISLAKINEYMKQALQNNYLDEDVWKKIDDFEDFMNQIESDYKIENKSALLLEQISSLMQALGVDKVDIVDELLRLHIIPLLKKTKTYAKDDGVEVIKNLLVKAFGDDNVSKSIVTLQKQKIVEEKIEENKFPEFNEFFKPNNEIDEEDSVNEPNEEEHTEKTLNNEESLVNESNEEVLDSVTEEKLDNEIEEERIESEEIEDEEKPSNNSFAEEKITDEALDSKNSDEELKSEEVMEEKPKAKRTAAAKKSTAKKATTKKTTAKKSTAKKATTKKASEASE